MRFSHKNNGKTTYHIFSSVLLVQLWLKLKVSGICIQTADRIFKLICSFLMWEFTHHFTICHSNTNKLQNDISSTILFEKLKEKHGMIYMLLRFNIDSFGRSIQYGGYRYCLNACHVFWKCNALYIILKPPTVSYLMNLKATCRRSQWIQTCRDKGQQSNPVFECRPADGVGVPSQVTQTMEEERPFRARLSETSTPAWQSPSFQAFKYDSNYYFKKFTCYIVVENYYVILSILVWKQL